MSTGKHGCWLNPGAFAILLAITVACNPATQAGKLRGLNLSDTPTSLLEGRLIMATPPTARIDPTNENMQEMLVRVEAGGQRMLVEAEELFALSGDELRSSVESVVGPRELDMLTDFPLDDQSLHAVAIAPEEAEDAETTLALGLFVEREDRSLLYLGFHANRAAARDFEGCRTLAGNMARTLGAGPRQLDTDAGPRWIDIPGANEKIRLDLPAGFAHTHREGPDFTIDQFIKLLPIGALQSGLGVYLGDHPVMHHAQAGVLDFRTVPGQLLDQKVEWRRWYTGADGGWMQETTVDLPASGDSPRQAHVFFFGSESQLVDLAEIVRSLAVVQN